MLDSGKLILWLGIAACCCFQIALSQYNFEKFNNDLVKTAESDNVDSYFAALPKMANHYEAKRPFAELAKLSTTKCNSESLRILADNDRMTGFRIRTSDSKTGPLIKAEEIIRMFAKDHAKDCQTIYLARFEAKLKQPDMATLVKRLESFFSRVTGVPLGNLTKTDAIKYSRFVQLQDDLTGKKIMGHFYETFQPQSKHDRNLRSLNPIYDWQKKRMVYQFKEMSGIIKTYFLETCESFIFNFGPMIFDLYDYDSLLFDQVLTFETDSNWSDFFRAWGYYRLCKLANWFDENNYYRNLVSYVQENRQNIANRS